MSRDTQTKPKIDAATVAERLTMIIGRHGKSPEMALIGDWYLALAETVRDMLGGQWAKTGAKQEKGKRANYLSMEYLLGPNTQTALDAAHIDAQMREALRNLGQDPEKIISYEPDPGLGNGGLGRLAACFLDSGANIHLPLMGYGLFYNSGFFTQAIDGDGRQRETPDLWLSRHGNPWGEERTDITYKVRFFGWYDYSDGNHRWCDGTYVKGVAHDMMIPGFDGETINTLRLWRADTAGLAANGEAADLISRINEGLYPDDSNDFGKKLRVMQEYFFTSLSLQDIVARHLRQHKTLDNLAETAAVQLNDTHPAMAIAELMRLLIDEHGIAWERAKAIVRATCFYTNHTLMPEALEKWHNGLLWFLLPRHMGILTGLHKDLMREVDAAMPDAEEEVRNAARDRIGILAKGQVRMGHLAAFFSGQTNGVSAMHSDLVRDLLFPDLTVLRGPTAVTNHTNGITPRRWLFQANPALASLISRETQNDDWVTDLKSIDPALERVQDDPDFRNQFAKIKKQNKQKLAALVLALGGPVLKDTALYDVQIKRFHEYKRQFLNLLHTVALYQDILANPDAPRPDTVKILAGKAAPSYKKAKEHIAFTNWLARTINNDPRVGDKLKLVFIPEYNVSKAQIIIPASDISEQISTAGTEASGTSNMKFALNGAVTVGTRDGANVEIGERTGEANIFFFGHTQMEIHALDLSGYDPKVYIKKDKRLADALAFIKEKTPFLDLADDVLEVDRWKLAADFGDYWKKQDAARNLYLNDPQDWLRMAIVNVRAGAHFTSDETIREYAQVWGV